MSERSWGSPPLWAWSLGTCLLIAGLSCYARAKGRSGLWGAMGLLSIIGLIVLACLEDRNKAPKTAA
jgi:hypothetical protein